VRTKRDAATLAWAIEAARTPAASIYDKLSAMEFLVAYGLSSEADDAMKAARVRMRAGGVAGGPSVTRLMGRLAAISRRFREERLESRLRRLGGLGARLLDGNEEAVLSAAKGARTLLVVFGTMNNDFWVSYPVLHCLLPTETVSVLYLKDPRGLMYLRGLQAYGDSFESLCAGIGSVARDLSITDIRVTAFSSGGYGALLLASRLGARAFLGFSIRTDLSPASPLPMDRYVTREKLRQAVGDRMVDLEPVLRERAVPGLGVLYYGDGTEIDAAHARHLAGLSNFIVKQVPDTRHNTVMTLLTDGSFERALRRFLH
jgi:hypothetical protein